VKVQVNTDHNIEHDQAQEARIIGVVESALAQYRDALLESRCT
jgi:hypothetical protein